MGLYQRGNVWWIDFRHNGQRYRESTRARDNQGKEHVLAPYDYKAYILDEDFDFTSAAISSGGIVGTKFRAQTSGAGATVSRPDAQTTVSNHIGILQLQTGTTTTGYAQAYGPAAFVNYPIIPGSWEMCEWIVRVPTLSTGTERFIASAGTTNTGTGSTMSNGLSFQYSDNVNGGAWTINVGGGIFNTSITVVAGTWYRLTYIMNAGCNNAWFNINGALVQTLTSASLPTAGSGGYCIAAFITKTAGTTSRNFDCDRVFYKSILTRT